MALKLALWGIEGIFAPTLIFYINPVKYSFQVGII